MNQSLAEENNAFVNEDLNSFIRSIRKHYYKGQRKTFRDFMSDLEELAGELGD